MLYDCFIFNDELDLLEIRLNILKDVVDYFVIFESDLTFSQKLKPLYFKDNANRYSKFFNKIIHVPFSGVRTNFVWANEWTSRNLLLKGLSNCLKNDYILYSDVDEIPKPKVLQINWDIYTEFPYCLEQVYHYYGINLICENHREWPGTIIGRYGDLILPQTERDYIRKDVGFQQWRENRNNYLKIKDAGWHYSYCVGIEGIKNKVRSFCHAADLDVPHINNDQHILNSINNLESLNPRGPIGDGIKLKRITIDDTNTSKWLLDNHKQYPNLIW
jgi:hypothetical protein